MRILVTGGAGYIGSHTVKHLSQLGVEPIVYDNLSTGHRWAVQCGELIAAELSDTHRLRAALEGIDAVVHFAARTSVPESAADPSRYYRNNIFETLHLLDCMRDANVKTIVFSSSAAVYGAPKVIPIPEDHVLDPTSPYGETKLTVEKALRWYGEAYGIRWAALRYFNAAGADADGALGESHTPETHLIPLVLKAALGRRPALEIFGTDYATADGTAVRDYVHVSDLATAHELALRHLVLGRENLICNLGTEIGYSVREVVDAVETVTGYTVPTKVSQRRPGDPPVLVADSSKSHSVLGWQPRSSDLTTIVESAFRWELSSTAESRILNGNPAYIAEEICAA